MAKTKTAKADTKTSPVATATSALRTGTRAYLGLYATAYARTKMRLEQIKTRTDGAFDTLVARGEVIEGQAVTHFKTAQAKVSDTVETGAAKVRQALPKASNDRVAALEAEIDALNVKIKAVAKTAKPKKAATKAALKTDKTPKAKKAA